MSVPKLDERTKIFGAIAIATIVTMGLCWVLPQQPQQPQTLQMTPEARAEVERLAKWAGPVAVTAPVVTQPATPTVTPQPSPVTTGTPVCGQIPFDTQLQLAELTPLDRLKIMDALTNLPKATNKEEAVKVAVSLLDRHPILTPAVEGCSYYPEVRATLKAMRD